MSSTSKCQIHKQMMISAMSPNILLMYPSTKVTIPSIIASKRNACKATSS